MARRLLIINGPNLNLLGTREPDVYGAATLGDVEQLCADTARTGGATADCFQSNHEGELIDRIHEARGKVDAMIINPGGYSHTSVALRDALSAVDIPVYEVHISNIHARETFRHHSYISAIAKAVICGCGVTGYKLAILAALEALDG